MQSWLLWLCCSTSRIATCHTKASLLHIRDNFVMYWLTTIAGVGWSSGTYYNSCREGQMSTAASLNTVWQSCTSTSSGSWALATPRVSKLITRSERIKWYILPRSTAVFPLHSKVFQSNHSTTWTEAGCLPPQFSILFTIAWCSVTLGAYQNRHMNTHILAFVSRI